MGKQFSHHLRMTGRPMRGFTLMEMLTALALFGLVAGLLASSVVQAMRIADRGGVTLAESRDVAMRAQWFRDTVGASFAAGSSSETSLQGAARALSGRSGLSPAHQGAVGDYRYELVFDAAQGRTQLVAAGAARQVLFDWSGSAGAFRYLDDEGNWHDRWPARDAMAAVVSGSARPFRSTLPVAVELQYADRDGRPASLLIAIQDRAPPPPTYREFAQ